MLNLCSTRSTKPVYQIRYSTVWNFSEPRLVIRKSEKRVPPSVALFSPDVETIEPTLTRPEVILVPSTWTSLDQPSLLHALKFHIGTPWSNERIPLLAHGRVLSRDLRSSPPETGAAIHVSLKPRSHACSQECENGFKNPQIQIDS